MAYDIFNKYNLDDIDDDASLTDTDAAEWKQVATKSVRDADGFMTEYTWYTNGDLHIFMFGDSALVEPDETYADWTCETEQEAQEWFDSYSGFEEEEDEPSFFETDLDESNNLKSRGVFDSTKAPKDSEYVLALKHTIGNSYTFLGYDYRMTSDLNRAITYTSIDAAKDDEFYVEDAIVNSPSFDEDSYYYDRIKIITIEEAKKIRPLHKGLSDYRSRSRTVTESSNEAILTESYNNLPEWLTKFLDSHRDGKSIKNTLSSRGVDLHNCSYVRAPFPRSNRDPILKDETKLKIFKLIDGSNEVIYVYDVNNPYVARPHSMEHRYVTDMPMRDILDLAIEFGYIDLADAQNIMKDKRRDRANLAYSLRDVTRDHEKGQHPVYHHTYAKLENGRTDWNNIISTSVSWVTKEGYDKSGYKLNPDKYRKMLDDVGLETYGARLQSFYNKIEAVRARIIALMNSLQFDAEYDYRSKSSWNQNIFGDLAEATDRLSRAMDYYQRIKRACAEIVEDRKDLSAEESIEWTNSMIKSAFRYDGDSFNDNLKEARELVKGLESAKLKQ